jgi:hypothetical protein
VSNEGRQAFTVAQAQAIQLFQDLSDQTLQDLAGDKAFAKGKAYAVSGAVQDLVDLPPAPGHLLMGVEATVQGTETYATEIWWLPEDDLNGQCDCPQGQDGHFCKHQVALALVWRAHMGGGEVRLDPAAHKKAQATAKRAQTQAQNKAALRAFVQAQSAADLAERLWRWAEQDRDAMAEIKVWHSQTQAQQGLASGDVRAVQAAIRDLLKNPKGYLEPRDCAAYQRRAEQAFPLIASVCQTSPSQALALCEDMLARIYKVGETADDSWGGEIGDLVLNTLEVLKTCLQAEPPPASWLKTWLALKDKDPWGLGDTFELMQAAGPAMVKAYSAHVAHDWQTWQARNPGPQTDWNPERNAKREAYLADLSRQGDDATVLEVMRASAHNAGEWHVLVQWCEARKRWREAFDFAQKAYKLFPQDWRTEADMLTAYERDGWDAEALAMQRVRLERSPSTENYRATLKAAQAAGQDVDAYRQALMDWAQGNEHKTERSFLRGQSAVQFTDVSVRVRWYLEAEKAPQTALDLVQQLGVRCDPGLLLALAQILSPSQDAQALEIFQRLFEAKMPRAQTPYAEVLSLVRQALDRMQPAQRSQWLASLRSQYKAKRNFIKELPVS